MRTLSLCGSSAENIWIFRHNSHEGIGSGAILGQAWETQGASGWLTTGEDGSIYATIKMMVEIGEYRDRDGRNPFREWVDALDFAPAQRVAKALYRLGLGNFSNIKSVGAGVLECKIHFGPATGFILEKTAKKS